MKKSIILILVVILFLTMTPVQFVTADAGAIWTTGPQCGSPQDQNIYYVGDEVYIRGEGFLPNTAYIWQIFTDPPNPVQGVLVAEGELVTDAVGAFCIFAYEIQPADLGEYKALVDGKADNFRVATPTAVMSVPIFVFLDLDKDGIRSMNEPGLTGYEVCLESLGEEICGISLDGFVNLFYDYNLSYTFAAIQLKTPANLTTANPVYVFLDIFSAPVSFGLVPQEVFLPLLRR